MTTVLSANLYPWLFQEIVVSTHGMFGPFVTYPVKISLTPHGLGFQLSFRPLIDDGAHLSLDGEGIDIGFYKVLLNLGAHHLHKITEVSDYREVAKYSMACLETVAQSQEG